jgi:hypothetical protein
MKPRIHPQIVTFTLLLCAVATPAAGKHPHSDDAFFGLSRVHTFHLRLSTRAWELMQPTHRAQLVRLTEGRVPPIRQEKHDVPVEEAINRAFARDKANIDGQRLPPNSWGYEFAWAKARFECDGTTLNDIGLRLKGNSSYELPGTLKRPFKLDFSRFAKGQKFRGVSSVNLRNNAYDPSHVREALCYQFYRDAGVPAPRTAFALVYLTVEGLCDRRLLGLYTLVEDVDEKPFLKSNFVTTRGLLVKAEAMRGMPDMRARPEPYAERFEIKTHSADPRTFARVMDLIRLPHGIDDATFAREIQKTLDLDNFLRYLAMTVLLVNTDSMLTTGHNYYLHVHPNDQKLRVVPWDTNLSMGNFPATGSVDHQIDLSINHPWAGQFRLIERILAVPAHRQAYHAHLRTFIKDAFNPQTTAKHLAAVHPVLEQAKAAANAERAAGRKVEKDASSFPIGGGSPPPVIDAFVARRVASVLAQLDQGAPGKVPGQVGHLPGAWPGSKSQGALGSCNVLAFALLHHADADGDFRLSPGELRDALSAFHAKATKATPAEGLDWATLADALDPVLAPHLNSGRRFTESARLLASPRSAPPKVPPALWAHAACRLADADSSGKVDLREFLTAAARQLRLADRNHDDLLDERELAELLDEVAAAARRG